ncbi:MAG: hypothetical protein IKI02_09165 [Oscillospiraceae bacterium]|nr:hypothetical protein [Oscillospiraceae bacterium]
MDQHGVPPNRSESKVKTNGIAGGSLYTTEKSSLLAAFFVERIKGVVCVSAFGRNKGCAGEGGGARQSPGLSDLFVRLPFSSFSTKKAAFWPPFSWSG